MISMVVVRYGDKEELLIGDTEIVNNFVKVSGPIACVKEDEKDVLAPMFDYKVMGVSYDETYAYVPSSDVQTILTPSAGTRSAYDAAIKELVEQFNTKDSVES